MTQLALFLTALFLTVGLGCCTREDGLPDPPFQPLVPCHADGGAGDPLACPPASPDAAVPALDAGLDA